MSQLRSRLICLVSLSLFASAFSQSDSCFADEETNYTQTMNIVYAETDGIGLVLHVFVPKGQRNGKGVVDVACGAFYSDRGKINDHKKAKFYDVMCGKGYVVFAIRPGSITKFSVPEMMVNLNKGVAWVVEHADEYKIDPNHLGLQGASAGGYLACLCAVAAEENSAAKNIKAVGVFFPVTDFANYGPFKIDARSDDRLGQMMRRLYFPKGVDDLSDEEIKKKIAKYSPNSRVTSAAPPFLFIHGDADFTVPLQQSKIMVESLKKANVPVELIIKPGGGHPWPTIAEEVKVMGDWFDKQMLAKTDSESKSESE